MAQKRLAVPAAGTGLREWRADYQRLHIDVGTGDGRYAVTLARREPSLGVVGLDTNLDHVVRARNMPANVRFVTSDARAIPDDLHRSAAAVSINFPYGSLLTGLIASDRALLESLAATMAIGAHIDVFINARALTDTGMSLEGASLAVQKAFRAFGLVRVTARTLGPADLRRFPSTWGKRIGFGRDARAVHITARAAGASAVDVASAFAGRPVRSRDVTTGL